MLNVDANPKRPEPGLWRRLAAREPALVVAAAVFQLAILGWMIGGMMLMFRDSRVVLLQVVPVDPRDLMRGDYVILSYPFSRVPSHGIMGLPGPSKVDELETWQRGSPVFVTLIPEADGVHYRGGLVNSEPPPPGTVYIQGTIQNAARIEFGIESFYVQEGQGKAYEEAVKQNQLWAEVALTPNGWGTVRGLRIEGDDHAGSSR
ncbi:MAG: GDYXXLXY domain-containing protein [Paludisphaera borealis]|uniref:GDYXXLXY domain-containing protein n=1 Tax=Paludisphaera borealis TaxID=1387353 RepID=UPI00284C5FCF|nr:GDYXXLXY domain-containing protein [Paludisphaera borealis]MDR3619673.1 GDYXXLXY domain-containing protein [Paludisphaera borealis]